MATGTKPRLTLFRELRRRRVFRVVGVYIVAAWAVIQVADVAFPGWGIPESAIRYVFLGAIFGFPLALLFGWRYDVTPRGIVRTVPQRELAAEPDLTLGPFDYAVLVLLVVVAGLVVYGILHSTIERRTAAGIAPNSIAVLPFANMSGDPEQRFFSDGITEEILNLLAGNEELRVAARTSSFSLRDEDLDVPAIGERLRVQHVLEGSVRRAGDQVRITAQLIEAETGYNLWSDSFEASLGDIFAVQDAIATQIVRALSRRLGSVQPTAPVETGRPTEDPQAYEQYLLARHYWRQRGEDNIRKAVGLLQEVVRRDPEFAHAWAALASAYITLPAYTRAAADGEGAHALAVEAARRALALDETIGEAYLSLAQMAKNEGRWNAAEEHYRRAIDLSPSEATAKYWYGEFLAAMGRYTESRRVMFDAAELDPLAANIVGDIGWSYLVGTPKPDYDRAVDHFRRSWNMGLHAMFVWFGQFLTFLEQARYDEAERWLEEKPYPVGQEAGRALIDALREPGDEDRVVAAVTAIQDALENGETLPRTAATYYGYLGEVDLALEASRTALGTFGPRVLWSPSGSDLRRDPRFVVLVRDIGLVEHWERYGWTDFCRRRLGRIECF